ncbi:MAG: MFS transporter [Nitriliruptoraceae bacterium]
MLTSLFPDPYPPRSGTRFSGWRIVAVAAVALGMTGPGQTVGISVFIDPMIEALGLSRSQVSGAYLIGTLSGAFALPHVGRFLDARGTRITMALVGGVFGTVLMSMAGVVGLITLVLGFAGIRMFGQGALGLVATTAAAPWFDRRRGLAIGITTAVGSAVLSLFPVAAAAIIPALGWRGAWIVTGLVVWLVVVPLATWVMIDHPRDVGQEPDGAEPSSDPEGDARTAFAASFTRAEALRTPMFWAVAGATAATGMIGTGLSFHQIDLLGEQGLTSVQAAANFLPQTFAALGTTLVVGSMVDRFAARWVLATSMLLLTSAMVGVSFVEPGWSAIVYGMSVGAAGASARALEAASFPKLFGLAHIGSIRGVVTAISVGSTAFGPLALSLGRDLTGSYQQILLVLVLFPVAIIVLGLLAPAPTRAPRLSE